MGYILHLETATKVCSVAVSNNGELLAIKELEEDSDEGSDEELVLFVLEEEESEESEEFD